VDRKVRGMTLIEVVIVIAIISILMGFALLGLRNLVLYQRLKADTDRFMSYLNTARLYSMTGRDQSPWGVAISGNEIVLFRDNNSTNCNYDSGSGEEVRSFTLDSMVSITPESGCNIIVFDKKGYPRNSLCGLGMCSYTLTSSAGYTRRVSISRFGRINYETP